MGPCFMSLGSVDHQTERHAAASCPARLRLWSVDGQTSETVIVGGGGPDVRPISSPHVQVFFSALFSSLFFHVWFILHVSLNMMFSDTLGIFYSIYYICGYFFLTVFSLKIFCMFVF